MVKVSFDFDRTLSEIAVQQYAAELIKKGVEVWITTSREPNPPVVNILTDNKQVFAVAKELGIPEERIVFISHNPKWQFMQNFVWHLDDLEDELKLIKQNTKTAAILYDPLGDWLQQCNSLLGFENYELLNLFPIPVLALTIPDKFSSVMSFLDKQEMSHESDMVNYGERSKNSYLMEEPECADIKKFILDKVLFFSSNVLHYDYDGYRFGQSWISIKRPGQHHTMHTHPNSLISGVFFYGNVEDVTPALTFHKMTGAYNVSYLSPKLKGGDRPLTAAEQIYIPFKPGLLLLFPSYLFHSVPLNKTENPRKSFAFNTVPERQVGDEKSLTELKYVL